MFAPRPKISSCSSMMLVLALAAAPALASSHMEKKPATKTEVKAAATSAKTEAKAAEKSAEAAEMEKKNLPGEHHAMLKSLEGKWKAVTKSWFAPGEPQTSEGVSENRIIMGGRFLEQKFNGTAMGQPFEGYGLTGYDNQKGEYSTLWVDNMTTAMMSGTAKMDAAGQMISMAKMDGPDGKPVDTKMVTKIVDPNKHVFTVYTLGGGKETPLMEITYTRQ